MTVLNTEMHAVTFVITVFELVMLFFAIIWLLSRPGDVRRRRYVVLLILLIFYNIFSGLFPDEKLPIPVALQLILAYLGGFSVSMYFVYYIYKTFDLESLKTISVYGTIGFLFLPFIIFFVLTYMITGDAELSRQLVVIFPFIFSLIYLYTLTKALWKRYIIMTNHIEKEAIIGVFISVLLWATLPVIVFFEGSQVIENGTTNTGFMIMSVLYIRSAIYRSREDYQKILHSEEALREANETLQQKVNERTRELEIANDEKLKAYLNLVHETKTPLTLINNYLDKLIQKCGDSEELHITKINIDKLTKDMEHFFDIQKAANGGLIFHHHQIIDWSADLETILPIYRNWAVEKAISFTVQIEPGLCIKSDPTAINRIVGNLVSNAIKFTEPGGFVKVALNGDEQEIQFSVKDSGMGISEARQAHLYEPYYQLSRDKSNTQGLGLGLSIVKITVDSLHGSIDMMSKPGLGTSFTVRLPRYMMANDETLADTTIQNNLPVGIQRDVELNETVLDVHKPVILIVEDNKELLKMMCEDLKEAYNVYLAENGKQAMEKLRSIPVPELIISDIMMDEMDGIELLSELRKLPEHQYTPFVFLSAKADLETKVNGYNMGAVDYMPKPFHIKELSLKIKAHLTNNENQKFALVKDITRTTRINSVASVTTDTGFEEQCKKYNLTPREMDVVLYQFEGKSYREIADLMHISEKTVSSHISRVYHKLNVAGKHEMIKLFGKADG